MTMILFTLWYIESSFVGNKLVKSQKKTFSVTICILIIWNSSDSLVFFVVHPTKMKISWRILCSIYDN